MWEVLLEGKPSNVNRDRNRHWATRSQFTKETREAIFWLCSAAKIPKGLDKVGVTVEHHTKTARRVDVAACVESVKAAIDGMVDYGLIPDDNPDHLLWVKFVAPYKTGNDELLFIIEDLS